MGLAGERDPDPAGDLNIAHVQTHFDFYPLLPARARARAFSRPLPLQHARGTDIAGARVWARAADAAAHAVPFLPPREEMKFHVAVVFFFWREPRFFLKTSRAS